MLWGLLATNLILVGGLAYALWKIVRYRELRKMRGLLGEWPVPPVEPGAFDPRLATGPLGPSRDSEIRFVAMYRVIGGISDLETWIICNLAKTASRILEIGTATGKTAYLLAANSPPGAEIVTITLAPDQVAGYREESGDDPGARRSIGTISQFAETFYYTGTPEAAKIRQLFGDSKTFDETPFLDSCDIVFIDGSHARSYVESDTRKALRMVKPGGVVLWHDYRGPRAPIDVFRALNALRRELPSLVHIRGTALVAYRRPDGAGVPIQMLSP